MHSASSGGNISFVSLAALQQGGVYLTQSSEKQSGTGQAGKRPHRKPLPWKAGDPSLDPADTTLQYTAAPNPAHDDSKHRMAGGVITEVMNE